MASAEPLANGRNATATSGHAHQLRRRNSGSTSPWPILCRLEWLLTTTSKTKCFVPHPLSSEKTGLANLFSFRYPQQQCHRLGGQNSCHSSRSGRRKRPR